MFKQAWLKNTLLFLLFLIFGGLFTLRLGQDVNYDLKNYHFYNAYAYLNNRYDYDLSAAQLQTYFNPFMDIIYYKLVLLFDDPIIVTFALGLWYGLFAWATFRIFTLLQPTPNIIISLAGTTLGVSGVAALGQAGTTTNEVAITALIMTSFMLLIEGLKNQTRKCYSYIRLAGFISGIAVGFKLTAASFAIAFVCALVLLMVINKKYSPLIVFQYITMSAFGFLLTGGYWHFFLWQHYDSPLFPYYNTFFQSPYYEHVDLYVSAWRATTLEKLFAYPFELSQISRPLKEEMFSDPRLLLGFIAAFCLLISSIIKIIKQRRLNELNFNANNYLASLMLSIVWLVGYFFWAYLHGIYRYAIFLEALSPILLVVLLYQYKVHSRWIAALMLCITLLGIHYTNYLSWGRINYGMSTFEVHPPSIAEKSLVIMLSGRPMSYVIPFFSKETKFVYPKNNLNLIEYKNKLQQKINDTIEKWTGPMYVLAPRGYDFMQDNTLSKFSLRVEYDGDNACKPIISNIDNHALQICGLKRE